MYVTGLNTLIILLLQLIWPIWQKNNKIIRFSKYGVLAFITLAITNFCPFRSICNRFWNKISFKKMSKLPILQKFWKIIKFSKYGALAYYNPCIFPRLQFFQRNGIIWQNCKNFQSRLLSILQLLKLNPKFSSVSLISLTISEIRIFLANLPKLKKIQSMVHLHIMTLAIPNFRPFCSVEIIFIFTDSVLN